MTPRSFPRLPIIALLLVASAALGQQPPTTNKRAAPGAKMIVERFDIGYPAGPHTANPEETGTVAAPISKLGAWAPVYVTLQCVEKYDGQASIELSTPDCDDVENSYTVPVPNVALGQTVNVIGYVRTGSHSGDVTLRVVGPNRKPLAPVERHAVSDSEPSQMVYLAIGSRLANLKLPEVKDTANNTNQSRCSSAVLTAVAQMSTRWFGYGSADMVLLVTGDRKFTQDLVDERDGRKLAIAEWVRRGGRLIVSVGRNQDLVAGSPELAALIPGVLQGVKPVELKSPRWATGGAASDKPLTGAVELATLAPRTDVSAIALMNTGSPPAPVVAQMAYGTGLITFVGFDLDQPPFTTWGGQGPFWKELLERAGPRVAPVSQSNNNQFIGGRFVRADAEDAQLDTLVRQLEDFPGVPVISFGWVALFILLYIIVVGPLDYFILKKVVKRLELTWITFPTVVVVVSAVAYFTAYALKGNDLRVNKIDLLDIDIRGQQAIGRSYFTVFSPRIQNYTVAVNQADWLPPVDGNNPQSLLVSWMGQPRGGKQSLFHRDYRYESGGAGLTDVPIQVWSTKGFQAEWTSRLDPAAPPISAELSHGGTSSSVIGSITSRLPANLEEAAVIIPGGGTPTVIDLGTLVPNVPRQLTATSPIDFGGWSNAGTKRPLGMPTTLLFADKVAGQNNPNNASLRGLDMSWRLQPGNADEVILVGRFPVQDGRAADIVKQPGVASQLWLGALPQSGQPLPALNGSLRQDTLIRVVLPVGK